MLQENGAPFHLNTYRVVVMKLVQNLLVRVYGKLSCLGREVIEIAPSKLGYFKKALGWIKVSELSESFYFNFVSFLGHFKGYFT